jgi:DNA-binding MltR family transcriptional regulator
MTTSEDDLEGLDPSQVQARFKKFFATIEELKTESDRGVAILGVSMLDQRLVELIRHLLVPCPQAQNLLGGNNAPLGTFASRLDMAVAIGLIGQNEYKECNTLRKIRNDFAHKFEVAFSFRDNRVSDLCGNLKRQWGDQTIELVVAGSNADDNSQENQVEFISADEELSNEELGLENEINSDNSPRGRFIKSVLAIYEGWLIRDFHTEHRKMEPSGADEVDEYFERKKRASE